MEPQAAPVALPATSPSAHDPSSLNIKQEPSTMISQQQSSVVPASNISSGLVSIHHGTTNTTQMHQDTSTTGSDKVGVGSGGTPINGGGTGSPANLSRNASKSLKRSLSEIVKRKTMGSDAKINAVRDDSLSNLTTPRKPASRKGDVSLAHICIDD
jgi:hypothetical protein